ncbi:MAG: hypothetical protein OEZ23_02075, partial [Gammaproteobacteria bacterium]|nr:hypothetical protein [Gammaproteobacteria bacterium]
WRSVLNRLYPNIDLEGGGSVQNWGNSLDEVLKLSFDSVIPGHGKMATREDLLQFQQFIRQLASVGTKAASEGKSLAAFQESSGLTEDAGYSEVRMIIPVGLNRNFVLKRSWEEANNRYIARD